MGFVLGILGAVGLFLASLFLRNRKKQQSTQGRTSPEQILRERIENKYEEERGEVFKDHDVRRASADSADTAAKLRAEILDRIRRAKQG